MIFGIGTDIVAISRFERFLAEGQDGIFRRLFTEPEIDYCSARKRSAQHYALRFAAKEAFFKALGTGVRDGITWHDVEVVNDPIGKPDLLVSGRSADLCAMHGIARSFVSLSHDGGCAVATVVLES